VTNFSDETGLKLESTSFTGKLWVAAVVQPKQEIYHRGARITAPVAPADAIN
jgi:hypothetical protein